jgi:hypothetical protein
MHINFNTGKKAKVVILRDKEIRGALHQHLMARRPQPSKIVEELGIHNGNAIADLVAFYEDLHCFEIKGATDSIRRITQQAVHYNHAFPKITLVTTQNHWQWCCTHAPSFWGIMIAYHAEGLVKLKYLRQAKNNPHFSKKKALMMLWKDELSAIAAGTPSLSITTRHTREDIALKLSEAQKKRDTLNSIRAALFDRKRLNAIGDVGDMAN